MWARIHRENILHKKYVNTFITITVVHVFIACDKNLKPQLSLKSETSTELKIWNLNWT